MAEQGWSRAGARRQRRQFGGPSAPPASWPARVTKKPRPRMNTKGCAASAAWPGPMASASVAVTMPFQARGGPALAARRCRPATRPASDRHEAQHRQRPAQHQHHQATRRSVAPPRPGHEALRRPQPGHQHQAREPGAAAARRAARARAAARAPRPARRSPGERQTHAGMLWRRVDASNAAAINTRSRLGHDALARPIDFYFDFSSPYSYIASSGSTPSPRHGRTVNWKAILLGVTFQAAELKSPGVPPDQSASIAARLRALGAFAGDAAEEPAEVSLFHAERRARVLVAGRERCRARGSGRHCFRAYFARVVST